MEKWVVAVQTKQLSSQLEQETQKRTGLQSELKTAQQQITQLKTTEKQLTKVLLLYFSFRLSAA